MEKILKDKIVLITGASRGIGKAISRAVAAEGANAILSARSEDALSALKKEIMSSGGKSEYIVTDLDKDEEVKALFSKIKNDFGKLDIIVNNAAIVKAGKMKDFSIKDFDSLIRTNLRAVYLCCQQALKLMIPARSGYIINISSVVGFKGYPDQTAYTASKHGIVGMSKALAAEVQKYGIRISLVHPGGVDTDLVKDVRPDLDRSILMQPEDIAQTVMYLLSLSKRAMVDEIYIRRSTGKPF